MILIHFNLPTKIGPKLLTPTSSEVTSSVLYDVFLDFDVTRTFSWAITYKLFISSTEDCCCDTHTLYYLAFGYQ